MKFTRVGGQGGQGDYAAISVTCAFNSSLIGRSEQRRGGRRPCPLAGHVWPREL